MDQILAFLNNQQWAILAGMLVPFIYKYVPKFKNYSNELCTLLAALSAWAMNVFGPTPAHASVLGGALGAFGSIFIPALDALVCKLLHDAILNPAYKAFGVRKPLASVRAQPQA